MGVRRISFEVAGEFVLPRLSLDRPTIIAGGLPRVFAVWLVGSIPDGHPAWIGNGCLPTGISLPRWTPRLALQEDFGMSKVLEDRLAMKKTIQLFAICATLGLLALPAFANRVFPGAAGAAGEAIQDPCSPDGKIALYTEFYKELKGDQAKAYEAAKKYVACPTDASDDAEVKRIVYLRGFIAKYEKADHKGQLTNLVYAKKDYAAAFDLGKQILADDPSYLKAYIDLGYAGTVPGNPALVSDGLTYAKKAIELIEAGGSPDNWAPWSGKDEVLSNLNYSIGALKLKASPEEAIPYYIKAASYNTKLKTSPFTYSSLAGAYEDVYAKQQADYTAKYGGKEETPESKLAQANIDQVVDRIIDAFARAVALADSDEKAKPDKKEWLDRVTELYKYRTKSEAGLDLMLAGILSKPLPPRPTPLTALPTPVTTPASGSGGSGTGATPGTATTSVQPNKTAIPTTTPKTTGPTRPKMQRAHAPH
jgi:hypothetical protein